ncbi:MAG: SMP-30/gluconolactonase/LRE family protein [Alphaproteobacteria bacterium]|nr:SMP-30/gluconolactonase/LRE family protein [Alphaproteobacteria bacterium]
MTQVDIAVREPTILGESPFWDGAAGLLWWIDIRAPSIQAWSPATGAHRRWLMPATIGCIVPRARGGLLVGLHTGFHAFDPATGALAPIARPDPELPDNRPNDARCDRNGRFWCGTMENYGRTRTGSLYRLDADRALHKVDGPYIVPNSITFAPDGRRMTFTDTRQGDILAYDYDPATATRRGSRVLLAADGAPGRPDGSCVDAEGCVWNARFGGGCVVRVTPDGRVDRIIELPAINATACAFGGARLDELYVTTGTLRMTLEQLGAQPAAGSVFVLRPGVGGVPEAAYAG